jgi:hypothetical protein
VRWLCGAASICFAVPEKKLEKVLEKLATTEKTTITIAREVGGKVRVTSGSWDGEKVILKDEVLEVRNVDGRLYVSRKARKPDEWDPPIAAYDPYGPGTGVVGDDDFVVGDEHADDWLRGPTRAEAA